MGPADTEECELALVAPRRERSQVTGVANPRAAAVARQEAGDGEGFPSFNRLVGNNDLNVCAGDRWTLIALLWVNQPTNRPERTGHHEERESHALGPVLSCRGDRA